MLKDLLKKALSKGLFSILSSQVLNKLIQFISSIVLIRILSKPVYGIWTYAYNTLNMFILLQGLGLSIGVLQFVSATDDPEKKKTYLLYGLKFGARINILLAAIIGIISFFIPLNIEASTPIFRALLFIPLFVGFFESIQNYLRGSLQNNLFSLNNVINSTLFLGLSVLGVLFFGVYGIVAGRYLAYVFCLLGILVFQRRHIFSEINQHKDHQLSKDEKKQIFRFSIVSSLTGSISALLYLLDTFLVGLIIPKEEVVASYKTATQIPFALTFIPSSVMVFAYPYFVKMKENIKSLKKYTIAVSGGLIVLNAAISAFLFFFAEFIITLVFGPEYKDSVVPFRILAIGYFFAGSFRIPFGNILASIRKVKVNLIIAIISGICNIVLDVVLILNFGANGAAVATVGVFIISSLLSGAYLFYYLHRKKNEDTILR